MSNFRQLIQKYCPDGVPFVLAKDVVSLNNYKQLGADELEQLKVDGGDIPLLPSSRNYDWYTTKEVAKDFLCEGEVFTMGRARHANTKYVKGLFVSSNNIIIESSDPERILTRFLFHFFTSKISEFYVETSTYPKFDANLFKNIRVPVPPLEIQLEIVRILDSFTDLSALLVSELEDRKKQFEYYRETIFDNNSWAYCSLTKHFPFVRNGFVGTVTSFFTDKENGVRYLEGTNIHNGFISDNEILYVTKDFHKKHIKNELKADDVLMVQSGHIGDCAVVGEKYKGSNCHALIIMSNAGTYSSRFLVHYFHTKKGLNALKPAITDGNLKHVLAGKMEFVKIPDISLSIQNEIADLLDKFDTYCSNAELGLPAEICLRSKQYEHYRDLLLSSFKELKA